MKRQTSIFNQLGLSYLEIIAGIIIISFILVGMNSIFGVGIRNSKKAENISIAVGLAQELMENLKSKEFSNIESVQQNSINGFSGFSRNAVVTPNYNGNAGAKLIKVIVKGPDVTDIKLDCIIVNPKLL